MWGRAFELQGTHETKGLSADSRREALRFVSRSGLGVESPGE